MTKTLLVQPDGSVSVSKEELGTLVPVSRSPEIRAKMGDPNSSPEEVLRLISGEIAILTMKIRECERDPNEAQKRAQYLEAIQALRAAEKAYVNSKLAEKGDRLNFDGLAFKFLYKSIIGSMEKAIGDALGDNHGAMRQEIMNKFHGIMKKEEPRLRRGVREIGSRSETKDSGACESGKC